MKDKLRFILAAGLMLAPAAVSAQQVVADISISQGPVSGHVVIGDPYRRPRYAPERARVVVVYRSSYHRGWYHHRGYRAVRVWYDSRYDRYYDRYDSRCAGLREVWVYERDGRYYRDDWRDRDRGGYRHDGRDRDGYRDQYRDDDRDDYRDRTHRREVRQDNGYDDNDDRR